MFLLDINVWLAMAFEVHAHHLAAKSWFEGVGENSCLFCRYTQTGFLRLATNPALFEGEALTLSDAWTCYDALLGDFRVGFAGEPLGLDHFWRRYTMGDIFTPKIWNDAYLAAYALAGGMITVTFDKGFTAFDDLSHEILQ